jgi:hypothetical protein
MFGAVGAGEDAMADEDSDDPMTLKGHGRSASGPLEP